MHGYTQRFGNGLEMDEKMNKHQRRFEYKKGSPVFLMNSVESIPKTGRAGVTVRKRRCRVHENIAKLGKDGHALQKHHKATVAGRMVKMIHPEKNTIWFVRRKIELLELRGHNLGTRPDKQQKENTAGIYSDKGWK